MNKRLRKVFNLLKTKAKAFGFSRKELESAAQQIDDNLKLEENASEEDIDAAIEEAVDAAIPFLKLSQSAAQRSTQLSIQRFREKHNITDDDDDSSDDEEDDDEDGDDDDQNHNQDSGRNKGGKKNKKNNSREDALMKLIEKQNESIQALQQSIIGMKGDQVKEARRKQLKQIVDNTGTFGKTVMKNFDMMTFKDDDDFDDYLDDVQKDLDDLNQERANEGLGKFGGTSAGGGTKDGQGKKNDIMSDDDIIAMAGGQKKNN